MQHVRVAFLFFLFSSLLLAGCDLFGSSEEEASSMETEEPMLGTVSGKVDGTDWEATGAAGAMRFIGPLQGSLAVSGLQEADETGITVGIFNPNPEEDGTFEVTPGTYKIGKEDGGLAHYSRVLSDETEKTYEATSGEIVVEAISSERIRGTFAFDGEASDGTTVVVTEGAFDVGFILE